MPSCSMTAFRSSSKGGKALDAELAQLVPHAGLTSAQTDGVIPAGPLPSLPLASKPESRIPQECIDSRKRPSTEAFMIDIAAVAGPKFRGGSIIA